MQQRARTVAPEHLKLLAPLAPAERATGLPLRAAYLGLLTCADRAGRFAWDPAALKLAVLPSDDVDFSRVLLELSARGFLVHYAARVDASLTRGARVEGFSEFGEIVSFVPHQVLNNRERPSEIPGPAEAGATTYDDRSVLHNPTPPSATTTKTDQMVGEESPTPPLVESHASNGHASDTLSLFGAEPRVAGKGQKKPSLPARIQAFVDLWNVETRGSGLPSCLAVTGQRLRDIEIALSEEPDLGVWREAIRALLAYPHALGNNDRAWKAEIGFLVKPSQRSRWLEKGRAGASRAVPAARVPGVSLVEEAFLDIDQERAEGEAFERWLRSIVNLPSGYRGEDPRLSDRLSPAGVKRAEAALRAWWRDNVRTREV